MYLSATLEIKYWKKVTFVTENIWVPICCITIYFLGRLNKKLIIFRISSVYSFFLWNVLIALERKCSWSCIRMPWKNYQFRIPKALILVIDSEYFVDTLRCIFYLTLKLSCKLLYRKKAFEENQHQKVNQKYKLLLNRSFLFL